MTFFRIQKVAGDAGANGMGSLIQLMLTLKSYSGSLKLGLIIVCCTKSGEPSDRHPGQTPLVELLGQWLARGVHGRNLQQSPAEILILVWQVAVHIGTIQAKKGVDEQIRTDHVGRRDTLIPNVFSAHADCSLWGLTPGPPRRRKFEGYARNRRRD